MGAAEGGSCRRGAFPSGQNESALPVRAPVSVKPGGWTRVSRGEDRRHWSGRGLVGRADGGWSWAEVWSRDYLLVLHIS